ncbi:MAG: membrane protein insertase YidC, partial [Gammaproteobacteria bacterium]|nr:membrane protein insertase YidC [Gammaproteobacteria bacterium]
MENQRFFLYIALAFLLYIIWLTWQQEQAPAPVAQQDSIQQQNDEIDTGIVDENNYENSDDLPDTLDASQTNNVATNIANEFAIQNKSEKVHVRTDVLDVIIDTRGGDIRQIDLPTYPVSLQKKDQAFRLMFSENNTYIAQSGLRHDKINGQAVSGVAPTHHEIYRAEQTEYLLNDGSDELEVKLLWSGKNGITVEKVFTFYRNSFVFDVKHRVINQGNTTWVGRQYQQLRHSPISEERSWLRLPTYTGTAYFDGAYHKHKFSDVEDEPINMQVDGGWVAVLQ